MKNVLIISASPRKRGNSQLLCEQFAEGARAMRHEVNLVRLAGKKSLLYCIRRTGRRHN